MSEQKELDLGTKVIISLYSLSSILKLYEINNDAVGRIIDSLYNELQEGFEGGVSELHLMLRKDEFFINDQLLKVDLMLYTKAREVATNLDRFSWGDIRISSGLSKGELESFAQHFSDSLRASKSMFPSEGLPNIKGQKAKGSSAAAFRFEPEKLGVWLYTGLLDIVEQIYALYEQGETPSLLPIRRSLQMIIDNMKSHSGIYQMLSAIRSVEEPRTLSNQRVSIAIDAVGFGMFLNFPVNDLMILALSGILGGLSKERDSISSVRPLFRYRGLGNLALHLILTLHDSRAPDGSNSSILGQLLRVLESYHEYLDKDPSISEVEVMKRMVLGDVEGVDAGVAKVFARYKGPYPIGSTIQIESQEYLVVEQKDNDAGKLKPVVARLSGGKLIEKRDLRYDPIDIQLSERTRFMFE
jgi:hypothetical protein